MGRRLRFALFSAAAITATVTACGGHGHGSASSRPRQPVPVAAAKAPVTTTTTAPTTTTTAPAPAPRPAAFTPPSSTLVATLKGEAPASVMPGKPPVSHVPASWYGYPSILPVVARVPGWVEVREAQRPNESTAWVPASYVTLSSDPDYLVVSLATTHLQLFVHGKQVFDFPVGVGLASTPTVTGQFFIAMKVPPPNSAYGPFVLVTSAHSDTFTDWEGSGDGIMGIHGPIDAAADAMIGTTGAHVSNGCLRLHVADQVQLANVPPGTPLTIVG